MQGKGWETANLNIVQKRWHLNEEWGNEAKEWFLNLAKEWALGREQTITKTHGGSSSEGLSMSQETTGLVQLDLWNGKAPCLAVFVAFNMGFTKRIRTSRWDGSCSYRGKPLQKGAGAFNEQFLKGQWFFSFPIPVSKVGKGTRR